jgi:hypothetical protein
LQAAARDVVIAEIVVAATAGFAQPASDAALSF